jgi:hypothetical protein
MNKPRQSSDTTGKVRMTASRSTRTSAFRDLNQDAPDAACRGSRILFAGKVSGYRAAMPCWRTEIAAATAKRRRQ